MKDKILFESNGGFIKVKKAHRTDNYAYAERKGIDSVAFILKKGEQYGLVKERKPPMDDRLGKEAFFVTAFGGSNDHFSVEELENMFPYERSQKLGQIVIQEAREESGYVIEENHVWFISSELVSTQMNQMCYLYLVEVTGMEPKERILEDLEKVSTVVWKTASEIFNGNDWKSKVILSTYLREA